MWGAGAVQAGNKGHSHGGRPWALRERRAAGAAWGGWGAPGEAAWASAGDKGALAPLHSSGANGMDWLLAVPAALTAGIMRASLWLGAQLVANVEAL